jgi:hypothetical protein
MAPSPAAVLRSPPIQFFPFFLLSAVKRDKVLFSALKSFPEDLQSCPSPDFTECLTTIIQHLSLGSIKYHARAQSQIYTQLEKFGTGKELLERSNFNYSAIFRRISRH